VRSVETRYIMTEGSKQGHRERDAKKIDLLAWVFIAASFNYDGGFEVHSPRPRSRVSDRFKIGKGFTCTS
jgi:hypothetical protein